MFVFNCILATDVNNGLGFTESKETVSLPWKLANEWKYYMGMCEFEKGFGHSFFDKFTIKTG